MAAGIMIMLNRSFKIGDFVKMVGSTSMIKDPNIIATIINTGDNKKVRTPNKAA
jgi:small-conductance mechanosensitive channel